MLRRCPKGYERARQVTGTTHYYTLNGSQILTEQFGNIFIVYLYDESGSPIGMQYRTNSMAEGTFYTYLFEKNLQGDIIAVYNTSGTKLVSYVYDAWGNVTVTNHNVSGTNSGARHNPFRYRGYYYDTETGYYYLQSRYYNPEWGRFLNADSYLSTGTGLLGYNMYAYCNNNPVMYVDPTGEVALAFALGGAALWKIGLAAVSVIAVAYAADTLAHNPPDLPSISLPRERPGLNLIPKLEAKEKEKEKEYVDKYSDSSPRIHHIVAQNDKRALEAQMKLEDLNINRFTDPHNLVVIPQRFHKSMHTTNYYKYVNSRITPCKSKEEVYAVLDQLSLEILLASATGRIPWA